MLKFTLNKKCNAKMGYLVPLETYTNLPFKVKRIFYTYDVPEHISRGSHAYYKTEQILICLHGSIDIKCFDGEEEKIYKLERPDEALYIKPHIWRTTFNYSPNTVLLVLSSIEYDEKDYIRDYKEYLEIIKCR